MADVSDPADPSTIPEAQMRRIRALLAKAESTEFQPEADAIMDKVAELVAQFGIDEALLWATEPTAQRAAPTSTTILVEAPYSARKAALIHVVAKACGCRTVRDNVDANQLLTIIGFPGDIARTEMLSTSLLVQMTNAMLSDGRRVSTGSAASTAAWRRSFISGFASRIGSRLEAERARVAADTAVDGDGDAGTAAGASTALVLVDRDEAVASKAKELFPRLRNVYLSSGGSSAGRAAGARAADAADLGGSRLPGTSRALVS